MVTTENVHQQVQGGVDNHHRLLWKQHSQSHSSVEEDLNVLPKIVSKVSSSKPKKTQKSDPVSRAPPPASQSKVRLPQLPKNALPLAMVAVEMDKETMYYHCLLYTSDAADE